MELCLDYNSTKLNAKIKEATGTLTALRVTNQDCLETNLIINL